MISKGDPVRYPVWPRSNRWLSKDSVLLLTQGDTFRSLCNNERENRIPAFFIYHEVSTAIIVRQADLSYLD